MKHTTMLIEEEVFRKAKMLNINISAEVRNFLRRLVDANMAETGAIDYELLKMEYEKKKSQFNEINADLRQYELQLEKAQEIMQKKKEEELNRQKLEAEKLSKCQNCGQILSEKMKKHKFPIGAICNACFMTSASDNWKKWNSIQPQQP